MPQQPKRLSGCAIAAIVVGVVFAIAAIGIGVGGYVFVQKVGGSKGIVKSTFALTNPDYEILDFNDRNQTITVRHKKTRKTATIPVSHLRNGRIDPADLGLTEEEAEGTAGAPEWVKYPNAKLLNSVKMLSLTTLIYRTKDPVEKVVAYYKDQLADKGIQAVQDHSGTFVVDDSKGSLKLVVASDKNDWTVITVVYKAK